MSRIDVLHGERQRHADALLALKAAFDRDHAGWSLTSRQACWDHFLIRADVRRLSGEIGKVEAAIEQRKRWAQRRSQAAADTLSESM